MKPLKCELCDQNNSQYCNLQHHVGSVHEGKKQLKCETCDTTSSVKGDLKEHIPSDHEGKNSFKCESCGYMETQQPILDKFNFMFVTAGSIAKIITGVKVTSALGIDTIPTATLLGNWALRS